MQQQLALALPRLCAVHVSSEGRHSPGAKIPNCWHLSSKIPDSGFPGRFGDLAGCASSRKKYEAPLVPAAVRMTSVVPRRPFGLLVVSLWSWPKKIGLLCSDPSGELVSHWDMTCLFLMCERIFAGYPGKDIGPLCKYPSSRLGFGPGIHCGCKGVPSAGLEAFLLGVHRSIGTSGAHLCLTKPKRTLMATKPAGSRSRQKIPWKTCQSTDEASSKHRKRMDCPAEFGFPPCWCLGKCGPLQEAVQIQIQTKPMEVLGGSLDLKKHFNSKPIQTNGC